MALTLCVTSVLQVAARTAFAAEFDVDTAAAFFGKKPAVWGMRLSPDGQRVSFLKHHKDDFPIAVVLDLTTGKANLIASSDKKKGVDIVRCEWASDTRLLCAYFGVWKLRGDTLGSTRLVAVDADGSNMKVLLQRQQRKAEEFALNQSAIIDRLPDDPKHIWVQLRKKNGMGVSRVDIEKNNLTTVERPKQGVWQNLSDGRGEIRLRYKTDKFWYDWEYRLAGERKWHRLHRYRPDDDHNIYWPVSISPGSNELYIWDWHEGRTALFQETLVEDPSEPRKRKLVYSHSEVDVDQTVGIGKFRRRVGVAYRTEKLHIDYFDEKLEAIDEAVSEELYGQEIVFVDESWDGRFYLVYASSDVEPGAYYRFDSATASLVRIMQTHPWLDGVNLARMKPVRYKTADEVSVPGYLTRPNGADGPVPLIVFPHGGPSARDDWGYGRLPQFFASRGYAVLQANYRGSDGYGKDWLGRGGFHGWRRVVSDIDAGVAHLVEKGIADPERVCIVGWSFGGYAALISAIENPKRYRCVVSVAGVTHPAQLVRDVWQGNLLEKRFTREFVPTKGEDVIQGSPLKRAKEMPVPVQLFSGDMDLNVDVGHSRDLEKALKRAKKKVSYVEYEGADHSIHRQTHSIDMLQRMGDFLKDHLRVENN